jgi:hypothetical protein
MSQLSRRIPVERASGALRGLVPIRMWCKQRSQRQSTPDGRTTYYQHSKHAGPNGIALDAHIDSINDSEVQHNTRILCTTVGQCSRDTR